MPHARHLALALFVLSGCDAVPGQPGSSDSASPLMQSSVDHDAAPGTATRRRASAGGRSDKPEIRDAGANPSTPYERKAWPHWVDADHDCQDARTEVLIAESYEDVSFEDARKCEVASGRWQCPYTGKLVSEVHELDVDHLVPLANAHRSGGASWDQDQRRRYANDLEHPEHLIAVDYAANRSKADKGPEAWLPPSEDYRCTYVREWVAVKQRWDLSMTEAEAAAVDAAISKCDAGEVPELPQEQAKPKPKPKPEPASEREREPSEPGGECCRTCKSGKACGDACIAKTSECTKPPGCACNG